MSVNTRIERTGHNLWNCQIPTLLFFNLACYESEIPLTYFPLHNCCYLSSFYGSSHLFERGLELANVVMFAIGVPVPNGALIGQT